MKLERRKTNIKKCMMSSLQIFEKICQLLDVWIDNMEVPTVWNDPREGKRKRNLSAGSPPGPPSISPLPLVKVYPKWC